MLTYFETNLLSSKDVILGLLLKTMLKLKKNSTKTNKKNGIKKKKNLPSQHLWLWRKSNIVNYSQLLPISKVKTSKYHELKKNYFYKDRT